MLSPEVLESARIEIGNRFEARDGVLVRDLQTIAAGAGSGSRQERLGVDVRLAAERDLFERAAIVWSALQRCYRERGKGRYPGLGKDLLRAMGEFMTEAGVNLADHLRQHHEELAPVFRGPAAIDAEWLKTLRGRAVDRHARDIDQFARSGR